MTLVQLVPTLEVCQQLKAAGFPQDAAMVWIKTAWGLHVVESGDPVNRSFTLCAAPTAGELEEWLRVNNPCRFVTIYYEQYETPERRWSVASDLAKKPEPNLSTCRAETLVAALAQLCLEVAG